MTHNKKELHLCDLLYAHYIYLKQMLIKIIPYYIQTLFSIHPIPFQVILFYPIVPYSIPLHSFLKILNVGVTYCIDFMMHLKGATWKV